MPIQYDAQVLTSRFKLQCTDESGEKHTIATFHERRFLFGRRKAFIELHEGYEDILDLLVGMCLRYIPSRTSLTHI